MEQFKFDLPPKTPGVYALKHEPTGKLYVGSTSNLHSRFNEWRQMIRLKNARGKLMADFLQTTSLNEWSFWIVVRTTSTEEALTTETALIKGAVERVPTMILNTVQTPKAFTTSPRGTTIVDADGRAYTYDDAARILGCEKQTLVKRLAKYRAKGQTDITIETLRDRKGGRPPM